MPIDVQVKLQDLFNATNIAGYYDTKQQDVRPFFAQKYFPSTEVMGRKLSFITGRAGVPVVLRASALDANAPLRDFVPLNMVEAEIPFFREGQQIKEQLLMDLITFLSVPSESAWRPYIEQAYDGAYRLILGADATAERLRMQLLSTGTINILDANDKVPIVVDYGFDPATQVDTLTGTSVWTDFANSNPLQDIESALIAANLSEAVVVMTQATYNNMKRSDSLRNSIFVGNAPAVVTNSQVNDYFEVNYGVSFDIIPALQNNYKLAWDAPGDAPRKFFPDGVATIAPANTTLGDTVYGSTPEGLTRDMEGAQTEIVNTGVAVRTYTTPHTVNVNTVVAETVLPSFPQVENIHIINAYTA